MTDTKKCGCSDSIHDLLRGISVIERIEAAERHYRTRCPVFADGLKHAIDIAKEDGWKHIAYSWVDSND